MKKELKSQNERLQLHEERIDNQDKKILLLESHEETSEINDEKYVTYNLYLYKYLYL